MNALEMEKQAVWNELEQAARKHLEMAEELTASLGQIRAIQLKIQGLCNRLDEIERLETHAA